MKLEVSHISKSIKNRPILVDISLSLESGNVYGIVGRNGSGKTMLFRALSGLMRVDAGEIYCNGKKLHTDIDVLPNLGIILENADLYPEYTCFKNLQLLGKINKKVDDTMIAQVIEKLGLDPKDKRTYRKYSLGMKQRAKIAQAIMESPEVLILDEPTNALDEQGVQDVRQIILAEKNRGTLVILASHSQEDIRYLSDTVYYMSNGHLSRTEGMEHD